ncbi:MAG: FxLYD domain-containing protein [Candidatus Acidiferrales bacterium]|jgi:hypothetical protein
MEPEDNLEPVSNAEREERSRIVSILVIGAVVVLLLFGGLLLLTRRTKPHPVGAGAARLPFGAGEQAYAGRIHFHNLDLSHASNYLDQEFVYVSGTVSNDGARKVRALEATVEFHDPFNQVILRDTQRLIEPTDQPLGAGEQRGFQITIEQKIPSEWDQQYPTVRVTGLVFE